MNGSTQIPQGIPGRYSVPDPLPTAMFVLLASIFTLGGGDLVLRIELSEPPSSLERHTKLPTACSKVSAEARSDASRPLLKDKLRDPARALLPVMFRFRRLRSWSLQLPPSLPDCAS